MLRIGLVDTMELILIHRGNLATKKYIFNLLLAVEQLLVSLV